MQNSDACMELKTNSIVSLKCPFDFPHKQNVFVLKTITETELFTGFCFAEIAKKLHFAQTIRANIKQTTGTLRPHQKNSKYGHWPR